MRVLFGHQRFGAQAFGGVTRYFVELASALNSLDGVEASIFSPISVSEHMDQRLAAWPGTRRVPRFPGAGVALSGINLALDRVFVSGRTDVDVYHETYYSRFRAGPARAARILTVFDMIHELFPASFSALDRTRRIKSLAVSRADHIICISNHTRDDLVRLLGVAPERTSVVHLASSLSRASAAKPHAEMGQPYLLYVGQRSGYKNFEGMLRAFANSSMLKSQFRVVCFGGGELTPAELSLMDSLGLPGGAVSQVSGNDSLLAHAYSHATMLVYPSLYEGFGLPPLEAMALGCPVVCSNASSIPEVVGNAARLFDPCSLESVQDAMQEVADSDALREALAKRGLQRSGLFSWKACAEQTRAVYRGVMG